MSCKMFRFGEISKLMSKNYKITSGFDALLPCSWYLTYTIYALSTLSRQEVSYTPAQQLLRVVLLCLCFYFSPSHTFKIHKLSPNQSHSVGSKEEPNGKENVLKYVEIKWTHSRTFTQSNETLSKNQC